MSSKYQTPEFLELKKKWDKILKDDGFVDIEVEEELNAHRPTTDRNQHTDVWRKSKEEYYTYARYFLNEHEFETARQQNIWELHTEGTSARDIAKIYKDLGFKTSRMTIWRTINYLRALMKAKYLK